MSVAPETSAARPGLPTRLPRLDSVPGISASALASLAAVRVTLVQHLLAWPESELVRQTDMSPEELRVCFRAVYAAFVPRVRMASEELAILEQARGSRLSQAIAGALFDLTGAVDGDLVDVIGGSGSGKTQLCLTAAATAAAAGKGVVLFDTNAALSVRRLAAILEARNVAAGEIEKACDRVIHIPVATLVDAEAALSRLKDDICVARTIPAMRMTVQPCSGSVIGKSVDVQDILSDVGVIVFDSVASLLLPALGHKRPDGWDGYACSNSLASHFRSLARMTRAVVLVTNRRLGRDGDSEHKGALGRSWAHVCDAKVYLEEADTDNDDDVDDFGAALELKIRIKRAAARSPPLPSKEAIITEAGVVLDSV